MSNLFVSTRSQGTTPLAVPVTLKGTVSDAPKGLERFLSGDFLRGTVLGQDEQNRLLVRTDLGVLKIITQTPLPPGTDVTLELRQAGARIQVLILQAVPNESPDSAGTPNETPQARPTGSLGQRPALPDSIIQNQTIKAILQAPSPAGISSALPELSGRLPSGTELIVRVLSIGLPPSTPGTPAGHQPASASEQGFLVPGSDAARTQTPRPSDLPSSIPPTPSQKPLGAGQTNPLPSTPNPLVTTQTTPTPQRTAITPTQNAPSQNAPSRPDISTEMPSIDRQGKSVGGKPIGSTPPSAGQSDADGWIGSKEIVELLRGVDVKTNLPRVHRLLATSAPIQAAYSYDEPEIASLAFKQLKAISPCIEGSKGEFNLRITGQVTGTSGNGQPIMRTPLGTLTLDLSSPIPKGSSVALEISQQTLYALSSPAAQPSNLEAMALQDEVASFVQLDGVKMPLAEVGRSLGPSLLLFLSVLKGGRVAEWLSGEPISTPSSARPGPGELLLGPESAQFVRSVENSSGDWRLIYLPFLHMGIRDHLRLYLRQRKSTASQMDGNDKSKRFVVEANLPNWDNLQLDGFVTPERFDLIFRSERPLTAEQKGHVSAIFEQTLKFEDWQGQISFRTLSGNFMGGELGDVGELLV